MKKTLFIIFLLLLSSQPLTGQSNEEVNPITGFSTPQIDGYIHLSDLGTANLGEWDDAVDRQITFKSKDKSDVEIRQLSKTVGTSLFMALAIPSDIPLNRITRLSIQLDRNLDGKPSDGDIMVYYQMPFANPQIPVERGEIPIGFMNASMFEKGDWKPFNELEDGVPKVLSWARFAISRSPTDDFYPNQIEFELDLKKMDMDIPYPSKNPDPNQGYSGLIPLKYGIIIETTDSQFGFPDLPDFSGVIQPSVSVVDTIYYEIPPYQYIPAINFGIARIELTQVTQDDTSSQRIVRGKEALARVYVSHDQAVSMNASISLEVITIENVPGVGARVRTIYSNTIWDFPVPVSYARDNLDSSANFLLDGVITNTSVLILKATVTPKPGSYDPSISNNAKSRIFSPVASGKFNVYVMPINNGTVSDPSIPSNSIIQRQQEFMELIYPIDSINFINLDWRDFGTYSKSPLVDIGLGFIEGVEINNRLETALRSVLMDRRASGVYSPYPHQIHGIGIPGSLPGGGQSNPQWLGFSGRSSWGGSWDKFTMAHEINHNLGSDTWGQHAAGFGFGCGALLWDLEWYARYGDESIHELGWSRYSGLVPRDTKELMTYCDSPWEPGTWIGAYRWDRLLTAIQNLPQRRRATSIPTSSLQLDVADGQYLAKDLFNSTVRIVSGMVSIDGTGKLFPSFEQQGIYDASEDFIPVNDTNIDLEVTYSNSTQISIPVGVSFNTSEGENVDTSFFNIALEDNSEIVNIALINRTANLILDEVKSSGQQYYVEVNQPLGFKRGEMVSIDWSIYQNMTTIYSKVMYSPDGQSWIPISTETTGRNTTFSIQTLPGGKSAKLALQMSDGLDTQFYIISGYFVEDRSPELRFVNVKRFERNVDPSTDNPTNYTLVQPFTSVSAGASLSLNVRGQDQWGNVITGPNYSWKITGPYGVVTYSNGRELSNTFRFAEAGQYNVEVTVRDPSTGLQKSVQITVNVLLRANMVKRGDYLSFLSLLEEARRGDKTTNPPSSSTTTSKNTSGESTSQITTGISPPVNPLPAPIMAVYLTFVSFYFFKRRKRGS